MTETVTSSALDETAYREAARAWLAENAAEYAHPPAQAWSEDELVTRAKAWQQKKALAGYGAIAAPKAIGGAGLPHRFAQIFAAEEQRYHTPFYIGQAIGLSLIAAIGKHGTPEQFKRFMTPAVAGHVSWCQLFSEPGAGSDLAAVRSRAVRNGDHWVLNGQKVWSSWAHRAGNGILLARTDGSVPKHDGLTMFVLDMNAPGVEVRPIAQITGKSDFNEVFFTDVVIPDANRIGAEGEGWACAMTVVAAERNMGGRGGSSASQVMGLIKKAAATPRGSGVALDSAAVRAKLAQWWVEEEGLKHFGQKVQASLSAGDPLPATLPIVKLVLASKAQETNAFVMDLDEYAGVFGEPAEMEEDDVFYQYLWAACLRIAGGADEVLRNQLAERALGMPQDVRLDKGVPFDKIPN